ncbi:MAG: DUF6511 domain-containing protein [Roseovarius sp.]
MSHVACPQTPATLAVDCPERLRLWHPRFQPCAVCLRPARGFGFFDPKTPRPRAQRWFCSIACQGFFAARFKKGLSMIGMSEEERLAVALVMKRLGQTMDEIGWQKRLCDLSETDVTALIEEVLEGYGTELSRIAKSQEVPF